MSPTKGRVVEFVSNEGHACVGLIVKAWSDTCVNVAGWNEGGTAAFLSSASLAVEGVEIGPGQWRWPPRAA